VIRVEQLVKVYRVPVKRPGLWGSVSSLWSRDHKDVRAVDGISFEIDSGERVGFLGPNGAGKTTTLKMLTGLLHPTAGRVEVAGYRPQDRKTEFLKAITLVMGQKQQLIWDLPAGETFLLNRALFDISPADFAATMEELTALLDLRDFIDQPVRNLSLGQRMRCELAAALLHRPRVLFLDEPSIGLDVEVQVQVRRFIREYNARSGATVMLTSHDMHDVAAIVDRLILIDRGIVRFDGTLDAFRRKFATGRLLQVRAPEGVDLASLAFASEGSGRWARTAPAGEINALLAEVLRRAPDADLTVADPPLEEVLTRAFGESRQAAT
jgi:ABC-2 type transport system ATP-binding protein